MKKYQVGRLQIWQNPEMDPLGAGYNIIQSLIAFAVGGFTGVGYGNSKQKLFWLPECHTDFIFAVFAEEFGFIGTVFIISMYMIIIWRGIAIALDADDTFGMLLATGVTSMFMFHVMVNIGMTAGIMPVTGVPLPFLSYGVSSLTTNLMLVAILLNIKVKKQNLQF